MSDELKKVGRKPKVGYASLHTKIPEASRIRLERNAFMMGVSMGDIIHNLIQLHLPDVAEGDLRGVPLGTGLAGTLSDAIWERVQGTNIKVEEVMHLIARYASTKSAMEQPVEDPQAVLGPLLVDKWKGIPRLQQIETRLGTRISKPPKGEDIFKWNNTLTLARLAILSVINSNLNSQENK